MESLYVGEAESASSIEGFGLVARLDDALVLLEPARSTPLMGYGPGVRDAARLDEGILIATDEGLLWLDDFLQDSALGQELGDVTALARQGEDLWLQAGGLYRWRDEQLSELQVDGPLLGPFAAGDAIEGEPVLWASDAEDLFAIRQTDSGIVEQLAIGASSVAVSAGAAWAVAEGLLYRHDAEGWAAFALDEPIVGVWADPADPVAWFATDTGIYGFDGDAFALTLPDEGSPRPMGVDAVGRLILATDAGLSRVSVEPELAIVGILAGEAIGGDTEVQLYTNLPGATFSASVGALNLEPIDGAFTLDPYALLDADEHTLVARAEWTDGARAESQLRFRIGAPESAAWSSEIEPLYQERCANCHGGSTQTQLDSRELWVERIDDILVEVEAERMPLGGPALSQAQIALIRVWRDGGFPE